MLVPPALLRPPQLRAALTALKDPAQALLLPAERSWNGASSGLGGGLGADGQEGQGSQALVRQLS